MLSREQFKSAMSFFEHYDEINNDITNTVAKFFDGNILFKANDTLFVQYLTLLKQAMDLDEEDDPISYFIYEADENIYGKPDKCGICKIIGKADYKFCEISVGKKKFILKDADSVYDYIEYISK